MLFTDFVSTSLSHVRISANCHENLLYLIDTAYTETEGATFDARAVHVVADKKDQLQTKKIGTCPT